MLHSVLELLEWQTGSQQKDPHQVGMTVVICLSNTHMHTMTENVHANIWHGRKSRPKYYYVLFKYDENVTKIFKALKKMNRGIARNLLRGVDKRGGLGDGSPPAGSRDRALVGF